MALRCEWPTFSKGLPKKIFQSGFSISGLYDLRVLTKIHSINKDLRMSEDDALMLSPALMPQPDGVRLSLAVGGKELGGFKDQHRLIAQSWSSSIELEVPCPMDNHFSILETFADPTTELFSAAMQMFE